MKSLRPQEPSMLKKSILYMRDLGGLGQWEYIESINKYFWLVHSETPLYITILYITVYKSGKIIKLLIMYYIVKTFDIENWLSLFKSHEQITGNKLFQQKDKTGRFRNEYIWTDYFNLYQLARYYKTSHRVMMMYIADMSLLGCFSLNTTSNKIVLTHSTSASGLSGCSLNVS